MTDLDQIPVDELPNGDEEEQETPTGEDQETPPAENEPPEDGESEKTQEEIILERLNEQKERFLAAIEAIEKSDLPFEFILAQRKQLEKYAYYTWRMIDLRAQQLQVKPVDVDASNVATGYISDDRLIEQLKRLDWVWLVLQLKNFAGFITKEGLDEILKDYVRKDKLEDEVNKAIEDRLVGYDALLARVQALEAKVA